MTAAVVTFQVKPGKSEEFKNIWKTSLQQIEGTSGLGPLFLLEKDGGTRLMSIAFWQNAEQPKAWSKGTQYQEYIKTVRGLLESEPVREYYDLGAASGDASVRQIKAA